MYKYRLAVPSDLEALLEMCKEFYAQQHDSVLIPFCEDSTFLSLEQMLDLDHGMIVVAYESEDEMTEEEAAASPIDFDAPIVGMVGFTFFRPPINHNVWAAREAMFWIDPAHRKSHLARMMLSISHMALKQNDITHVYLTALANSPEAAEKLYAAMGYTEVERSFVKEL